MTQSTTPSIAVVGTGAIGGVMAAALGDSGHRVTLCARTPFKTLRRSYDGQTQTYDHPVVTSPAGMTPVDWVLLCTKAHQNEGAKPWLDALIGPDTRIAVMQNGVNHEERLAASAPPERVVPSIILLPAQASAPGVVAQTHTGTVKVPNNPSGRALAALFAPDCPVLIEPKEDFVTQVWCKVVINAAGGAIGALTLTSIGDMNHPCIQGFALDLMQEIVVVGRAEGAQIADDFAQKSLEARRGPIGSHWSSISMDRRDGRDLEWEARNAIVGEVGRKHGIPTPLNDAMTALLALSDNSGARITSVATP